MEGQVADILIQTGCLKISPHNPFTYASGLTGPLYCDNRRILGFPRERGRLIEMMEAKIKGEGLTFDILGAVATGAVPHGAVLAHNLACPFLYVRTAAKDHGMKKSVEGYFEKGRRVLLLEDLVNQGSGLEKAIRALRDGGLAVHHTLSIVDYEMPRAKERCHNLNVQHFSLTNLTALLSHPSLSAPEKKSLAEWHHNAR